MRKNYIILMCMICITFMFCNVHADPTDGMAYAVLTDNSNRPAGELILFRSMETYSEGLGQDGAGQTVTDIMGNTYTGRVYTEIEMNNNVPKWSDEKSSITSVRVADGQTIQPVNCCGWFAGCSNCTSIDLTGLDTANVTDMYAMFYGCSGLTSLDVSKFNTANVTDMQSMFLQCKSLTELNLNSFVTTNVNNMTSMFFECSSLTSLDISRFNTENVTKMDAMFFECSGLTDLDLSNFNTTKVTNLNSMFYNCSNLSSLNVRNFNTANVTNMGGMFSGCSGLTSLDVSHFNTANVTYIGGMFDNCNKLCKVILGQNFSFKGNGTTSCELPSPPTTIPYTGKWIREDGTYGPCTSEVLRNEYDASPELMSGEWIWDEIPTKYKIIFITTDGIGSMHNQKIVASESGTIAKNEFKKFNYTFDHWDGSDGNEYQDEQIIPANSFNIGDTLTLTAVFTKNDNHLNMNDGIAILTMHGGEKITLPDLKGGVTYQVWEETPAGWQQVSQTNPAGKITANETIDSTFTNEYVPGTATITLMAQKTLDGRMPEDDAFEFILSTNNTVVQTATNKSGMVTFKPITFSEPGSYVYTISEVRGDDDGINYDPHTETITITVADDGHGNLTASTDKNELPLFENMTKPGTLTLTKKANIATDETFTFEIVLENECGRWMKSRF